LTISTAFRKSSLLRHPDKRRSSSNDDTLAYQRLRTAYDTLRDDDLRRRYIRLLDHDKFIIERSVEEAKGQHRASDEAENDARRRRSAKPSASASAKPMALKGTCPNKCSCPVVEPLSGSRTGQAMVSWSCRRAEHLDVYGYELVGQQLVRGSRTAWQTLKTANEQAGTKVLVQGLTPGEWYFRVRAVSAVGPGDWSMTTEGLLLGDGAALAAEPEEVARREAEVKARAHSRKLEAQDAARHALEDWLNPMAQSNSDHAVVLQNLIAALGTARRSALPALGSDAAKLQRAEVLITELRVKAANRQAIAKWRPRVRELARGAENDDDDVAANELRQLVDTASREDLMEGNVLDMVHQYLKRCAEDTRRKWSADPHRVERVVAILESGAQRTDLWPARKIQELVDFAEALR